MSTRSRSAAHEPPMMRAAMFSRLPCAPYARIQELLRRLALLSALITLGALIAASASVAARAAGTLALVALIAQWTLTRERAEWSRLQQVVEGALLFVVALVCGPSISVPATYGGLNYRALG